MSSPKDKPQIWSINKLLEQDLIIPQYQRPYKWTSKNITELLLDIERCIEEKNKYPDFKYRIGSVILYRVKGRNEYEIVDGQQRLLSHLLLKLCLQPDYSCRLLQRKFSNKITQRNLHNNYAIIKEWSSSVDDKVKKAFKKALENTLEVVVIIVNELSEAFQLFDSQNTRGRALYPHDLLKAYHLREIHDKYDMQQAVLKWESKDPKAIRELFDCYLYPLWNWSKCRKCGKFTAAEIDLYKGIEESSGYTYAQRANKAMPYFLLTEPFISGRDFFSMVDHYMQMLYNIKQEISTSPDLVVIKNLLTDEAIMNESDLPIRDIQTPEELDRACKSSSIGLNHARNLFFCALLCYYDRFHNFDPMAIKKLFTWAMMLRVDMQSLGFDTINRYAIGLGDNDRYSNTIPMISMIASARKHTEISGISLRLRREKSKAPNEKWDILYKELLNLNGYQQ